MNKKFRATIIIFDLLMGLLLCFVFQYKHIAQSLTSGNTIMIEEKQSKNQDEDQNVKKIALTFDDGPHPYYTDQILDGLAERDVKATFFVMGKNAEEYPEIIKRMSEEDHLIGNHTYTHIQLTSSNGEAFKAELIKTNELLNEITGEDIIYVRPPYGSWDKKFEKELNMFPVLWTVDPLDWCSTNVACITDTVLKKVGENDIILMHDYYPSTVEATFKIIDQLKEEGYVFVTVEEILFD